jgi:nucleoside-diphosphate-sugar epimerase
MQQIDLNGKTILVTGAAGFIGSNLVKRLLHDLSGATIVGIDNMNDYYDPSLKESRLKDLEALTSTMGSDPDADISDVTLGSDPDADISDVTAGSDPSVLNRWAFIRGDIADKPTIDKLFSDYHFDVVVNLAAQAGVRYSITNPDAYIQSNLIGFYNILEACRSTMGSDPDADISDVTMGSDPSVRRVRRPVQHLVYASSSSVYGGNKKVPFSTDDRVDNPVSLYAATKKSNELMAHCYSKLYDIPTTGLRFFTVYGPAGRPDMAYFGFTNKLLKGETIQIYNYGNCRRDFTYVDDIVEGIVRVMQGAPERKKGEDGLPIPPYAIYNIGGGQPENLLDFVTILQEELVRAGVLPQDFDFEAHKQLVPMQPGDVPTTYADATALERDFGFTPKITLREGLRKFAEWYKSYYF